MRKTDYRIWLGRLLEEGVTHVVSFHGASVELGWMEKHADQFERIQRDKSSWGLYELESLPATLR